MPILRSESVRWQDQMQTKRTFSPVRAAIVTQLATVGFAAWFMCNSLRMSCSASGTIGSVAILVHTINCVLLLAAVLIERRWRLIAVPLLSWFLAGMLVAMFAH